MVAYRNPHNQRLHDELLKLCEKAIYWKWDAGYQAQMLTQLMINWKTAYKTVLNKDTGADDPVIGLLGDDQLLLESLVDGSLTGEEAKKRVRQLSRERLLVAEVLASRSLPEILIRGQDKDRIAVALPLLRSQATLKDRDPDVVPEQVAPQEVRLSDGAIIQTILNVIEEEEVKSGDSQDPESKTEPKVKPKPKP